jgi:hypothetical protein
MKVLQEPNFKIAQNEVNFFVKITIYKASKYCRKALSKKNAPFTFSHGEGRWDKSLRTTIKEGIIITNLTKEKPHPSPPLERMGGMEKMGGE